MIKKLGALGVLLLALLISPALAQTPKVSTPWFSQGKIAGGISVTNASAATLLPTPGFTAWVCNPGASDAFLAFGTANTVVATVNAGTTLKASTCGSYDLQPFGTIYSYIAAISPGGTSLTVETGTGNPPDQFATASSPSTPTSVSGFGAMPKASITRLGNTVTYTPNTGWNATVPTYFLLTGACRANGTQVLVPEIDIWSSANPTTKLQGILWLFSAVPVTDVSDNVNFVIAASDYANLTGAFNGIPFTLTSNEGSGAANSGVSLVGTTYQMQCVSNATTIVGMVQVVNAYVPASAEVLNVSLRTVGVN